MLLHSNNVIFNTTIAELSTALRKSLLLLAQPSDLERIAAEVDEEIRDLARDDSPLPILGSEQVNLSDWETGVEAWQQQSPSALYQLLGLKEHEAFANFNDFIDPVSARDPWADGAWQKPSTVDPHRKPLQPHWHQLVGILKMLDEVWNGKPIMLMDGVGLGKTLQVASVMALLVYYRAVKAKTGNYPGMFSKLPSGYADCTTLKL